MGTVASTTIHANRPEPSTVFAPWLSKRPVLLNLCLRWTRGNLAEAEDLLGEACLRVLEGGLQDREEVSRPVAFWATVINNLGRDRSRSRRRWKFDRQEAAPSSLGQLPAPTISAEQQVFLNECLTATAQDLSHLCERQRTAVLLRSGGLNYSEVGRALGTSEANARKLVETARRFLNSSRTREPRRATTRISAGFQGAGRSYLVGS